MCVTLLRGKWMGKTDHQKKITACIYAPSHRIEGSPAVWFGHNYPLARDQFWYPFKCPEEVKPTCASSLLLSTTRLCMPPVNCQLILSGNWPHKPLQRCFGVSRNIHLVLNQCFLPKNLKSKVIARLKMKSWWSWWSNQLRVWRSVTDC